MKEFSKKEEMLRVIEKVPLRPTVKNNPKRDSRLAGWHDTKSTDSSKDGEKGEEKQPKNEEGKLKSLRCYNCNKLGHLATDCRQPKREKGSCFNCGEMGHIAKDCSARATSSAQVAMVNEDEDQICYVSGCVEEKETFFKNVDYEISCSVINQKIRLNTLMDIGSKISFIKESLVPEETVEPFDKPSENYHGINHSPLRVIGHIRLNITLDNETINDLTVLVVPDATMKSSVVLGRNVLKRFDLDLRKLESQAIDDIFNIEISDPRDTSDSLNVNIKIPREIQSNLRKLFKFEYVEPVRPDTPKVEMELKLNLTEEKPFHFNPRRVSFFERKKRIEEDIRRSP